MAKHLHEVLENPMVIERPYRPPEPVYPMIKPDPKCGCGCGKTVINGYKYDDEYFYSDACVIRMMLNEGWLKRVG